MRKELLREVVGQLVAFHVGVRVDHALDNHGYHHWHGVDSLAMVGLHTIAVTVVLYVVAHGGNQVVRTVAADGATVAQLLVQPMLLDVSLIGHGHGTALREAEAERPPVVLEGQRALVVDVLLVELQSVVDGIHHLPGGQFLRQIRMRQVTCDAIALVIGGNTRCQR